MRHHITSVRLLCLSACIAASLASSGARAATFLVGADNCDFPNIQSAINAAASNPGPDTIRIAKNQTYIAQALRIGAQDLVIEGGFASCASTSPIPNAQTTISGAGGAADSVIVITGEGNRQLNRLAVIGGDETDNGKGGGIDFEGGGQLAITGTAIRQNRAGYGGGISFNGSTESVAALVLGANTMIDTNFAANSGGGVRLQGNALMTMLEPGSTIAGNAALGAADDSGYGGGLQILPPARAQIGSPGLGDLGAISSNRAKYGGGIAIPARDDSVSGIVPGSVTLFTTDPQRPVRVDRNVASVAGGGVYLGTSYGIFTLEPGVLCAYEFRLDHNRAPDGAALFIDEDSTFEQYAAGAAFFNVANGLTNRLCGVPSFPPSPVAVDCASGQVCNSIDHNLAVEANGQQSDGAIMELKHQSVLHATRVRWSNNQGSDVIHALRNDFSPGLPPAVSLSSCLIDGNTLAARVIASAATFSMRNCTIAGNSIGFSDVMSLTGPTTLEESIVWQPGHVSLNANQGALQGGFIVSNDPGSLPLPGILNLDPRFIDPANGDFHLRAASPAIDVAVPVSGDDRDLDFLPRDQDIEIADVSGPRDLGAYERQSLQPLVINPDFLTGITSWKEVTPGVSRFDPRENADGVSRGGSMFVNYQRSDVILPRVVARSQCIHLPLPGAYSLSGFARTSGSLPPISVQTATLHWEFRRDGGEACDGGRPDLQGDMPITSGLAWTGRSAPLLTLNAGQFNHNSSITISMVMANGGMTPRDSMRGWFDHIELLLGNQ